MTKIAPEWRQWLRRIGANDAGEGKAVINRGFNSGDEEQPVVITLSSNGTLSLPEGIEPPTDHEMEKIKGSALAIIEREFPVYPAIGMPPDDGESIWYEYRDGEGKLLSVVQRREIDGEKYITPWYYYKSGWQPKTPPHGCPRPLFGDFHGRSRIMVHEGEKACQAAIEAAKAGSGHPWQEELSRFGHTTWQGGGEAVGFADWRSLTDEDEVYILPDNDSAGYKAAWRLSQLLSHCKSVYMFHHHGLGYEKGWDIADDPGEYGGVEFLRFFSLAEQATTTEYDDSGKPIYRLRPEFVKKFAVTEATTELLEKARPVIPYDRPMFNTLYGKLSPVKDLYGLMVKDPHLTVVRSAGYKPRGGRIFAEGGDRYVNMWTPPTLKVVQPLGPSEIKPFLVYMRHLVPDVGDRKILIRRIARHVYGGERMRWAILLASRQQGTGKSTLARIVQELVGRQNTGIISGALITDKYTSWAENKQLLVVEELRDGSGYKMADTLKQVITEEDITVRRMYAKEYESHNHSLMIASTNHFSALALDNQDRRWFVPGVTEKRDPSGFLARHYVGKQFWKGFWEWFNSGGNSRLLWCADNYGATLRDWAEENDKAPSTRKKGEFMEASKAEWIAALEELVEGADAVCLGDVQQALKEMGLKIPRAHAISDALEDDGLRRQFRKPDARDPKRAAGQIDLQSNPLKRGYIHSRHEMDGSEWVETHRAEVKWLSDQYKLLFENPINPDWNG